MLYFTSIKINRIDRIKNEYQCRKRFRNYFIDIALLYCYTKELAHNSLKFRWLNIYFSCRDDRDKLSCIFH